MGVPSGENGRVLKNDYLAAIKNWLDCLPPKCIIPCEWLLVGSTKLCGRPVHRVEIIARYIDCAFARENLKR